jgi:hypothetical protein
VPLAILQSTVLNFRLLKIYKPSGIFIQLGWIDRVSVANAAWAAKSGEVVFSGEIGVFMNAALIKNQ